MHDLNAQWIPSASWQTIDETISSLVQKKGALDLEIGRWLLAAQRECVHRHFGFANFADYASSRFDYDARTSQEKVRVARAMEKLPRMRASLRTGERSWSAVRELTRVATPENEADWIAKSQGKTVRQVEAMVAAPTQARDPLLQKRRLILDLEPEEYALWAEAAEHVRAEIGPNATNARVLRALAEKELGQRSATEPGHQTGMTMCRFCERTWQKGGGEMVEVPAAVGAAARCDHEIVGVAAQPKDDDAHVGAPPRDAEPSKRAHVGAEIALADSAYRLVQEGGARALLRVSALLFGGPLRTVSKRLRAAVRARDGYRCVVPGCRHFRFIHIHHIKWESRGGPTALENLTSLCTQHHVTVHDGYLAIEGTPSTGLVFRHQGGTL